MLVNTYKDNTVNYCLSLIFVACFIILLPLSESVMAAQMPYYGSLAAFVEPPNDWEYIETSPVEKEEYKIFAKYINRKISQKKAQIYITLIPTELRQPENILKEIEFDKKVSNESGLSFVQTEKISTKRSGTVAINAWKSDSFRRYVGICSSENGVMIIVGTSFSKDADGSVLKAVRFMLKNATLTKHVGQ